MNQLPTNTGWLWIKLGFQYFKKQPFEFCMLFLGYLFFMLIIGSIPFLGQLLALVFIPLFTIAFMQACREIDLGHRIHPRLLLYAFKSPITAKLLQLGLLYLLAAFLVLGSSTLVDNGVFLQIMSGQLEPTAKNVEGSNMIGAMLFAMLAYIPAMMAFWFAGPLIAWQKMPLLKAIFYSFFAIWRSARVFLVYGLAWFTVGGILPTLVSVLIATLLGNPNIVLLIMMPASMLLTLILYCSFYPTYCTIFGHADVIEASTIS